MMAAREGSGFSFFLASSSSDLSKAATMRSKIWVAGKLPWTRKGTKSLKGAPRDSESCQTASTWGAAASTEGDDSILMKRLEGSLKTWEFIIFFFLIIFLNFFLVEGSKNKKH